MTASVHPTTTDAAGRTYPCFAGAVLVVCVDSENRVLAMSRPGSGEIRTVGGTLEHGESIEACAMRELHEEAGPALAGTYLGVAHTEVIDMLPPMADLISIVTVFKVSGGNVEPGSDMAGSDVQWIALSDLTRGRATLDVPRGGPKLWRRIRGFLDSPAEDG